MNISGVSLRLISFVVSVLFSCSQAQAQSANAMGELINACSNALVVDKVAKTDNAFTQLAITSLFGSQTAQTMGASGGGNYGVISGHGSYNKSDTSNTTAVSGSTYTKEEFSSYVGSQLSGAGAAAYQHCLDTVFGSPGLHIDVESYDTQQATIRVKYIPQPGTDTSNMSLRIWTNGDLPAGQDFSVQPSGYDSDIVVNILNPSHSLRFMVAALSNGHQVTSMATTLPLITTTVNDLDQRNLKSDVSATLCGGYHHTQTTDGPTVQILADPGYAIAMDTLSINREQIPGDRGGSPNSWYVSDANGDQKVAAHAECVVPDGNNFFAAAISISATEVKHTTYLQLPDDTGQTATFKLVTQ